MDVLVVEDDAAVRELVASVLAERGHRVRAFGDGQEAWEACQSGVSPLAVMDWILPGMNGLELCERLRSLPGGDDAVLLIITGYGSRHSIPAILAAGASDYLPKPFDLDTLELRLAVAESRVTEAVRRRARHANSTEPAAPGEDASE